MSASVERSMPVRSTTPVWLKPSLSATVTSTASWRGVTVPLITPAIFFNLVLGVIASFRVFAFAYVATAGGPARATYFYALHLYNMSFSSFDLGYGSALAWVLFIIVLVITIFNIQLSRRWVYYESLR